MHKLIATLMAAAVSLAGFADAVEGSWFTAGFGASGISANGSWRTGAEVTAPSWTDQDLVLEDVEQSKPVVFRADASKDASQGTVGYTTTVVFEGFSEFPEIDGDAKTGIFAMADGDYYVVGYDAIGETNKWVDTGIAAVFEAPVTVTVTVASGSANYSFGGSEFGPVAVHGSAFQDVCYSGNGSASVLRGNWTPAFTPTGVTVNGVDVGSGSGEGWEYHGDENLYYVTLTPGHDYVLSGTNTEGKVLFELVGDVSVTASNLCLKGAAEYECCLWVSNTTDHATLYLAGENEFNGTAHGAEGVCVDNLSYLVITNAPGFADEEAVLVAKGGSCCAGINVAVKAGDETAAGGTVDIRGGTIRASGGSYAPAIGSSFYVRQTEPKQLDKNRSGLVYIRGGKVYATGGYCGAGIGSGRDWFFSYGSMDVCITGGYVEAQGGTDAAGIGSGHDSLPGTVHITGGTVKATAGTTSSSDADGDWTKDDDIGGGWHRPGSVNYFTGGSILGSTGRVYNVPLNAVFGDSLYCVTVTNLAAGAVSFEGLGDYGQKDIVSIDGKAYLWLPNSDGVLMFSATSGGSTNYYRVTVNGAAVTAEQYVVSTLILPAAPENTFWEVRIGGTVCQSSDGIHFGVPFGATVDYELVAATGYFLSSPVSGSVGIDAAEVDLTGTIVLPTVSKGKARIGTTWYLTINDAFDAAVDGDTVYVGEIGASAPTTMETPGYYFAANRFPTRGLTINYQFNSCLFTAGNSQHDYLALSLCKGNRFVIKNAVFKAGYAGMADFIYDYAEDAELDTVVFDGRDIVQSDCGAVNWLNGYLRFTGIAQTQCPTGAVADVFYALRAGNYVADQGYSMGTVTFNTTGVIDGRLILCGGSLNIAQSIPVGSHTRFQYGSSFHSHFDLGNVSPQGYFKAYTGTFPAGDGSEYHHIDGELFRTAASALASAGTYGTTVKLLVDCYGEGKLTVRSGWNLDLADKEVGPLAIANGTTVYSDTQLALGKFVDRPAFRVPVETEITAGTRYSYQLGPDANGSGVTVNGVDVAEYSGEGWEYHGADNLYYVTLTPGHDYVLSGTNTQGQVLFELVGDVSVTASNLCLKGAAKYECCFWVSNTTDHATLYLAGENEFNGTANGAEGVCVDNLSYLVITNAPGFADEEAVLVAKGGNHCAGINVAVKAGDETAAGGTVDIRGGTIRAFGGTYAPAIGSSYYIRQSEPKQLDKNRSGLVYIRGGKVYATGGSDGAGIGSGRDWFFSYGSMDVCITGGYVEAQGGSDGAGIGSGHDSLPGTVHITGGTVKATAGKTDGYIYDGDWTKVDDIGGGWHRPGSNNYFTGGSILGSTGRVYTVPKDAQQDGRSLYCVTVTNLAAGAVSFEGLGAYGQKDIVSMDGNVYLWLPDSDGVLTFTTDAGAVTNYYRVTINGAAVTAEQYIPSSGPEITAIAFSGIVITPPAGAVDGTAVVTVDVTTDSTLAKSDFAGILKILQADTLAGLKTADPVTVEASAYSYDPETKKLTITRTIPASGAASQFYKAIVNDAD